MRTRIAGEKHRAVPPSGCAWVGGGGMTQEVRPPGLSDSQRSLWGRRDQPTLCTGRPWAQDRCQGCREDSASSGCRPCRSMACALQGCSGPGSPAEMSSASSKRLAGHRSLRRLAECGRGNTAEQARWSWGQAGMRSAGGPDTVRHGEPLEQSPWGQAFLLTHLEGRWLKTLSLSLVRWLGIWSRPVHQKVAVRFPGRARS